MSPTIRTDEVTVQPFRDGAAAVAALEELPPCGLTHDDHMAAWRSWRDDCLDPVTGCGFGMQDVDQCERGHPDDGVDWCGACGHTHRLTATTRPRTENPR